MLMQDQRQEHTLAAFLKQKRIHAGLSQGEVAGKLGYSTSQFVSNWERGISQPPLTSLKTLSELYKCSLDEMFEVMLATTLKNAEAELREKYQKLKNK